MMPDKIVDPNRGSRIAICCLGGAVMLCGLLGVAIGQWSVVGAVVFALIGLMPVAIGKIYCPYVVLSREGVDVRFLFRKKHYGWLQIVQAGRYWATRKSPAKQNFMLVLLCPKGSRKRTGKDKNFIERNLLKAIPLPNQREIREFIIRNYGHLNFDDYDGISSYQKKHNKLDET